MQTFLIGNNKQTKKTDSGVKYTIKIHFKIHINKEAKQDVKDLLPQIRTSGSTSIQTVLG